MALYGRRRGNMEIACASNMNDYDFRLLYSIVCLQILNVEQKYMLESSFVASVLCVMRLGKFGQRCCSIYMSMLSVVHSRCYVWLLTYLAEDPRVVLGGQLDERRGRAGDEDQQVGHRQVEEEEVGGAPEELVGEDDHDDEEVAQHPRPQQRRADDKRDGGLVPGHLERVLLAPVVLHAHEREVGSVVGIEHVGTSLMILRWMILCMNACTNVTYV